MGRGLAPPAGKDQVLNAILFLYRDLSDKEIGYVNGVVRAKRPRVLRLP
jgi:hypothetical protein